MSDRFFGPFPLLTKFEMNSFTGLLCFVCAALPTSATFGRETDLASSPSSDTDDVESRFISIFSHGSHSSLLLGCFLIPPKFSSSFKDASPFSITDNKYRKWKIAFSTCSRRNKKGLPHFLANAPDKLNAAPLAVVNIYAGRCDIQTGKPPTWTTMIKWHCSDVGRHVCDTISRWRHEGWRRGEGQMYFVSSRMHTRAVHTRTGTIFESKRFFFLRMRLPSTLSRRFWYSPIRGRKKF